MQALVREAQERLLGRRRALLRVYKADKANEAELQESLDKDWADRASETEGAEVQAALSERERLELEEIEQALRRIASNTYGHCVKCGGAIGRQRLRAVPETRMCLECSTEAG